MTERTEPRQSARDPWRQSEAAMTIAQELASLLFSRRLHFIDPQSRAELMEAAEALVLEVVEDFTPAEAYDPRTDAMQAWRDRQEQEEDR